jgi:hypothetical protein
MSFNTPILFLVFNRLDTTQKVFDAIREVKPKKLYISADGPRENRIGESEKCLALQNTILKQIDWDCDLSTNFRTKNLGCKLAISSGIDWFFKNEEKGIILEDDTLPHHSFFRFCEDLLEYYKADRRIMMISGDNFQFDRKDTEYSYYFSRYTHVWGWATWRRAWAHYDVDIKSWPKIKTNNLLLNILDNKKEACYWMNIFEKVYKGRIDTWDYQWLFACWLHGGLTILPELNLISNIGFGGSATHTKGKSEVADLKSKEVIFPLSHPPHVSRNVIADKLDDKTIFSSKPLYKKIVSKVYGLLDGILR